MGGLVTASDCTLAGIRRLRWTLCLLLGSRSNLLLRNRSGGSILLLRSSSRALETIMVRNTAGLGTDLVDWVVTTVQCATGKSDTLLDRRTMGVVTGHSTRFEDLATTAFDSTVRKGS